MNLTELKWLHQAQLDIMDEIHRLCVSEGITYFLIGGSMLGAVRHKGFIPWDLDIDCAMPRADYDHFKEACGRVMNPRFKYYDYSIVPEFPHPHALVGITGTRLVRNRDKYNKESFNPGIFLDILPYDFAPDDLEERAIHADQILAVKRKIQIKLHYCYDKSFVKKTVKWVRSLRYARTSLDEMNAELDRLIRRYNDKPTHYYCSMAGKYPYKKNCFPVEWFENPVLANFEDRQYFIPREADKYLTQIYGDYMKLPPESERNANLSYYEKVVFDKEYE